MKFKMLIVMMSLLFYTGNVFAANGNLIVSGNVSVGTGNPPAGSGITFPDGSIQSTSANKLVWDYTITGSAVSSVTSPALNGVADGGYEFEFQWFSPAGVPINLRLYFNGDQINANYRTTRTRFQGGTIVDGFYSNADAILCYSPEGNLYSIHGHIPSPIGSGWIYAIQDTLVFGGIRVIGQVEKIATVSNITYISLVASTPNGIGVGSRFRMWKKF